MRLTAALCGLIAGFVPLAPLAASTRFVCSANGSSKECAFAVFDKRGEIDFLLSAGQLVTLNDDLAGARYCVKVVNSKRSKWDKDRDQNDIHSCWKGGVVSTKGINK